MKKGIWRAVHPPMLGIEQREADWARWEGKIMRWYWGVAAVLVVVVLVTSTPFLSDVGLVP